MNIEEFWQAKINLPLPLLLLLSLLLTNSCTSQAQRKAVENGDTPSYYKTGKQTRDGIGKYYMGREIAHVMGHQGAYWLERPERDQEENTSVAVANMEVKPGGCHCRTLVQEPDIIPSG